MAQEKNAQDREELHRSIWSIADDLRGAVDGWDFKNYVLGAMFYRFLSEFFLDYVNRGEDDDFNYATLSDDDEDVKAVRKDFIEELGFFLFPSQLFCNVEKGCDDDKDLNTRLMGIFKAIEESSSGTASENDFKGLFDDFDVNNNKLGNTVDKRNHRLCSLLHGVAQMNLGTVGSQNIDAFGDAYEYLMAMYASNAGKSGGEFFTPSEVSELLTRLGTVGRTSINKVYDPACGSGSLLLKVAKVLGGNANWGYYGQEINVTTYNLCRINMFLHGVPFNQFDIACDDTLIHPKHFDDEPFDLIVSNPPYSTKWVGNDNPLLINDSRFSPAGVLAPKSKADFAFIMHSLAWLSSEGTAAIVCFPGIMYRGGPEQKIRQYLVDNNFVDCVIQLPSNLFFGTSIATSIMVLKKNKSNANTLFINAETLFVKVTNQNMLSQENIEEIVSLFTTREDKQYFSHLATYEEVKATGYNLSVSTYVESEDKGNKIDIHTLNATLKDIVKREEELRSAIDTLIAQIEEIQK